MCYGEVTERPRTVLICERRGMRNGRSDKTGVVRG